MNSKNKSTKLKYKTLIYLVIFSVFILLLLLESQIFFSKYLYEKFQTNDVEIIIKNMKDIKPDNMDNYLQRVVYSYDVCLEYQKDDGEIKIYNDTSGCLLGKDNKEIDTQKKEMLNNDSTVIGSKFKVKEFDSNALLYKVEVDDGNVFIYSLLANANKHYSLIRGQLIYLAIVIIILAIFLSLYLANLITGPIIKINRKAQQLSDGDYNVVFEYDGIKEIDELSDTLNYLESEVKKTDEYRRDLMANVSHDLKTPLTMIKAYAEMVRDISYKDKKKRNADLNIIISETERLNSLVEDILVQSKMQSTMDELKIETFDLSFAINSIVNRYEYLKSEGYQIILDIPQNTFVKADQKRISQVIYNLINNALNYTGDDKKVTIRVTDEKKEYLVEIIDTGKGIKQEDMNHIWDRYYKNEKNHKRDIVGTGLGLSIVKGVLESHNFDYGLTSTIGKGTTFFFRITKVNKRKV